MYGYVQCRYTGVYERWLLGSGVGVAFTPLRNVHVHVVVKCNLNAREFPSKHHTRGSMAYGIQTCTRI
jgi:hypothetical protein